MDTGRNRQPNPWRGEVSLRLHKETYLLRPTFEALSRIEQELGTGLIALSRNLAAGTLTLEALVVIIARTTEVGEGRTPDEAVIKEALITTGIKHALEAVALMLSQVFGGFSDAE